jgi:hypothetical protein
MPADRGHRTRQATGVLNLIKPRANLEIRANFFSVRVVDSWNAIPENIKMARNPGHFKRLYKAYRSNLGGE